MKRYLLLSSLAFVCAGQLMAQQVPSYNEMTLPGGTPSACFRGSVVFGDVNSDNNMDLMVKGRDLNNGWAPQVFALTTDGDGMVSNYIALPHDGESWERTLGAFDFNNDGHLDYLIVNAGAELYKNNGDGTFTKVEDFALETNFGITDDNGSAELRYMGLNATADFDLDGYQDLVVPNADGNPVLYKNNKGNGTFTLVSDAFYAQRGGTFSVGDYNNDGAPDLLVSGWNDEVGNDCLRINKNNGDGTFTPITPAGTAGAEKGQTIFADVDSDGLLDIFMTGESGPEGWARVAFIFKNNGDDTFTKVDTQLPGAAKGGADWIDVNGDGKTDLVYSGESDVNNNVVVAINRGKLIFDAKSDLLCRARGGAAVAAYDINKNGFPNIAVMGYNDNGAPHFHLFNGLCSRNANIAPDAPTGLTAAAGEGYTTFSWTAGNDGSTPQEGLRYNVYVKKNDGTIITNVLADPATGSLRQGNVEAALTTCSYKLNVNAGDVMEWGVQTIDGGKYASAFSAATAGIADATIAATAQIIYRDGKVYATVAGLYEIVDAAGRVVTTFEAQEGYGVALPLPAGVYFIHGQGASAKVLLK